MGMEEGELVLARVIDGRYWSQQYYVANCEKVHHDSRAMCFSSGMALHDGEEVKVILGPNTRVLLLPLPLCQWGKL